MTAWVVVPELALHESAPGVEGLPAEHVDGAGEGAERVHCAGDCKDSCREDDYIELIVSGMVVNWRRPLLTLQEDDCGVNPGHRSEILISLSSLEDLAIVLEVNLPVDALGAGARCGRNDIVLLFSRHDGDVVR